MNAIGMCFNKNMGPKVQYIYIYIYTQVIRNKTKLDYIQLKCILVWEHSNIYIQLCMDNILQWIVNDLCVF